MMKKKTSRQLFIFESLDEIAANGGFGRADSGNECGAQNCGNHEHHKCDWKNVIEIDAAEIPFHDPQAIKKVDRAEACSQHETDNSDTRRLDPDRPPDLVAQTADRLHGAKLPPSIRDGNSQC